MNRTTSASHVRYIATVHGVRDITLVGTADYSFWVDQLARENLRPLNNDGRSEIWLCADRLKWMGITFNELSVSIRLEPPGQDLFLIAAFNTSRFFAFCERTLFHTPYHHARLDVDAERLHSFALQDSSGTVIRATRTPVESDDIDEEPWVGRIYLPTNSRRKTERHYFVVNLSGATQFSPFHAASDRCELRPALSYPVVQQLIDSRFQGRQWLVRKDATHARSKTLVD